MVHGLITLIICLGLALVKTPIYLYLLPTAFYIGREVTQAEYRYIAKYGNGKRANMPWYGGFIPKAWDTKSMLDWLVPLFVSLAFIVWSY